MTDTTPAGANANTAAEVSRRRTFAIISHPDAGKTTLTEKFLLYGGAVQLAGSVTARKNRRATTSDWMELERQRGISVSSTVLQFEYRRSEEHTSELQSQFHLVCRLLLEKKNEQELD